MLEALWADVIAAGSPDVGLMFSFRLATENIATETTGFSGGSQNRHRGEHGMHHYLEM